VRGAGSTESLVSNGTNSEGSAGDNATYGYLESFDSSGFSIFGGSDVNNGYINKNSATYASWHWDAGSSTVSNTDGSITSYVRANQSAGFSIVTASPSNNAVSIGHGLNAAPSVIISKSRTVTYDWNVFHASLGGDEIMRLNTTAAKQTVSGYWNNVGASTFSVASGNNANNSGDMVYYCFAPVAGFSAFGGPYTGTGTTSGPFQYCGFRPRWIMIKSSVNGATSNGNGWTIFDTARSTYNETTEHLAADSAAAEYTGGQDQIDILSNGFKPRQGNTRTNHQSNQYIWIAFAENPFSANGGLAR